MEGEHVLLYHGSYVRIEQPDVTLNTGFSDLGQGFYLTDDRDAARRRALSRARRTGAPEGIVSVFALDLGELAWLTAGEGTSVAGVPFALRFDESVVGMTAWIEYVMACRKGHTAVDPWGEPDIVRAWIATEEVEMANSGMVSAGEVAAFLEPSELIVQYCLRSQAVVDTRLHFVEAETMRRA